MAKNRKNKKLLDYFEKGTTKWNKLNEFLNGFEKSLETLDEARITLDNSYPKLRNVSFSEILNVMKERKKFSLYDMLGELRTTRPCLQKRIELLILANILTKERGRRATYNFNENINEWRLPNISTK